ncbi:PKD domain-containing protein [Chitinophaga parva]|nr:PKD domain-containing protein [Chitinophaga parva]
MSNIKGYYEYLPAGYSPTNGKKYPLIIFFHGQGELASSSPLSSVLKNGLPQKINDGLFPTSFTVNNQQYEFIVLCPQFYSWPGSGDAIKFKDWALNNYSVDVNRIYITGLSMGGGEAWGALAENGGSKAFAAAVMVCGYYPPTQALAKVIAGNNVPVWALHNKVDPNVDPNYSINWVNYINSSVPAPAVPARLTIFDASGHDAWTKAYDPSYKENGMNIYEWMLQYSLGGTTTPPPTNPPPTTGGKRITVPMSNSANGRAEIYYPDAMTTFGVNPGDTLCIPAGEYEYVHLGNLVGTADKPIVITNCGGQVKLGVRNQGTATVFNAPSCRFIEISGSGDENYEYGFDLNGTNINGLKIFGITFGMGASDFDVHNLYIHDGNILLQAKTLQTCDHPEYLEGAFVMKNVKIHHLKAINSAGEGFYIGNTHYFWNDGTCTNLRSHWIENLQVYDNDLENIGSDGIQVAMAKDGDNRVYNNRLINYGMSQNAAQGYGILIGSGCSMKVYNNYVHTGFMPGIAIFGSGVNDVYNNVISDIHYEGINVSDKVPDGTTTDLFPPATANIYNNTIVATDSGKNAIKIFAYLTTIGHQVYNNLMVQKGTDFDYPSRGMYIKGDQQIKLSASNNLCYPTATAAGMVDSASTSFRLLGTSPAINVGRDMSDFSLKTDFDGTARPLQNIYDVGAFEVNASSVPAVPIAKAGNDMSITLPASAVTLNGSGSTPAPGSTIASYAWAKVSGPAVGTIASPAAAQTQVTGLTTAGTYIYKLTVTDKNGKTALDSVTVTVLAAANIPPVANAGTAQTITLPTSSVTVDGSKSTDTDGQIVTWLWQQTSGPAGAVIATPAAKTTQVTGLLQGAYTFSLIVTDDKGAKDTATVSITVNAAANVPPTANAGPAQAITLPANSVTVDGSGSTDPDGQIVTWLWQKVSGPAGGVIATPGSQATAISQLAQGVYVFSLTVTDNKGATNTATVHVTVNPAGNVPPTANAGSAQTITLPTNTVTVDGSKSTDTDGQIVTWLWQKVSGPSDVVISTPGQQSTQITGLQQGTYVFALTVTDDKGGSDVATVNITVNAVPNVPPTANAGTAQTITLPTSSVTLNGAGSTDTDGTIVTWQWQQTSGPAGAVIATPGQASTQVTALQQGTYTFSLTVTDNSGASATATVTVTVNAAPNVPPTADAGAAQTITLPTNTVTLDGSTSTDADGQIVTWLWKKLSGPAGGTISTPGAKTTQVTGLEEGTYAFSLTVTDNKGATAIATVSITVKAAPVQNQPPVAVTGGNLVVYLPDNSVAVNGSTSYDPDGSIVKYEWAQVSGPSTADIVNPAAASTNIQSLKEGIYKFKLTVTDNQQLTGETTFVVGVVPEALEHIVDTVLLFPNPASSYVRLKVTRSGTDPLYLNVYDLSGKRVLQEKYNNEGTFQVELPVTSLSNGYYVIQLEDNKRHFHWHGGFIKLLY